MGKKLKDQIDKTRKSIGQQTVEGLKMKGWLGVATKGTKELGAEQKKATSSLLNFGAAASLGGGPVASLASKATGLAGAIGKAGLVGAAVAGTIALVALDAVVLKCVYDVGKFAVATADAYRSENLSLQGMTKVWRGFWGFMQPPPGKADAMQTAIDQVAAAVPLARSKIVELNAELYRYRLRGNALSTALLAVAQGEAAAGAEGRQMGINMVVGAAMWGRSITGAANIMQSKFGNIVRQQMLALPTQIAKVRENFGALFRGLNVTPLLEGLRSTLRFLDQGTVGFNAWKTIFSTLFNPLFGGAKSAGDLMEHFFNRVTILTLDAQYEWIKMGGAIRLSNFGVKNFGDLLAKGITAASGIAISMIRTAQAGLMVADVFKRALSLLQAMWDISIGLGKSVGAIFGKTTVDDANSEFTAANSRLKEVVSRDALTNASNMLDSMAEGIRSSTPVLVGAVGDAMDAANAEVKKKQDMHSPSRVWAGFARNMSLGATNEFRAQTPRFAAAAGAMANVRPATPPVMQGGTTISNSQSRTWTGDAHFHGATQAGGMVTIPIGEFKRLLSMCFEGEAIHHGATL
jgi:hypothetical protein